MSALDKETTKSGSEKSTQKMACQRFDLTILVVDDDDTSLAIVANILSSWDYKVLTANSARNALKTLREFEGFFDLVIIEVHISGVMNGTEFQKRVKDEFKLPVIMMSTDNRKRVIMSKHQESGAALHLSKPICPDDFKDIWKYAMDARNKGKIVIDENEFMRSGGGELPLGEKINIIHDVNSAAASSRVTHESKRRKSNGKRKSSEMNNIEDQSTRSSQVQKKPKIVWTTYLHNLFLLAIKQLGVDKAVPKKILEAMNVPYLTRENVASHLQKYRIFLKKVAERGLLEGLSSRTLRSRFASGLSASVIKEIQQRSERLHFPVHQYLQNLAHQTEINRGTANYALKPSNQGPIHLHDQQLYKGFMPQNQQDFTGYNSLDQVNNMQQKMLGSYATNPFYQANLSHNSGPMFPSYGMGHHGLMTSSNGLTGSVFQNYDPLGKQSFRYGIGNGNNMASSSRSNNVPWISTSTCYPSSNTNSYGIDQLNGGPQMVETGIKGHFNNVGMNATIANNNSFGLVNANGTQNANMHVAAVTPLEHGNSGLVNGCSASAVGNGCVSEVPAALISNATQVENITRIPQLPQQLDGLENIGAGNEHQFYNAGSITESGNSQMKDDLSELFMIVEGTRLLNETEETAADVSECLNSDSSSSCNIMQSLEQPQTARDVIVLPTKSGINQQNESPTSSDQNPNQLQDNEGFVDWETFDRLLMDSDSTGSNSSAIEQDWDMELIEAFFCTEQN